MMGVAQSMEDAFHGEIRFPMIMHDNADHVRQQSAAFGRGVIEGQQERRRNV
jgi:hypothetical protein